MKKAEDTRTFSQIWADFDIVQKADLRTALYQRAYISVSAVNSWGYYSKLPKPSNRIMVAEVLADKFGIKTSPKTLFPSK